MKYIFHGENQVASRNAVQHIVDALSHVSVVRLRVDDADLSKVESLLGTSDFFSQEQCVVIEGFFSTAKSTWKDVLLPLLSQPSTTYIVWEPKPLTIAQLRVFSPDWKIQEFNVSKNVFAWLDSVYPGNGKQSVALLHRAVKQDGAEFCFILLVGLVRKLLLVTEDLLPKTTKPFVVKKLQNQAARYRPNQLLQLQTQMLKLELQMKTGTNPSDLQTQLDLLLLGI